MIALMEDESFFDAVSNTLPAALSVHAQLEQMLSANLALARQSPFILPRSRGLTSCREERNDSLRPALDELRAETQDLFTRANELKGQFTGLERAQIDSYKVRLFSPLSPSFDTILIRSVMGRVEIRSDDAD